MDSIGDLAPSARVTFVLSNYPLRANILPEIYSNLGFFLLTKGSQVRNNC
jgi:hypothetical protein